MVDGPRVEKVPDKIVWLSPNCCELTLAREPPRPVEPTAPKLADQPLPRLARLLQRMPRLSRSR
jgi:hypothetical protein